MSRFSIKVQCKKSLPWNETSTKSSELCVVAHAFNHRTWGTEADICCLRPAGRRGEPQHSGPEAVEETLLGLFSLPCNIRV